MIKTALILGLSFFFGGCTQKQVASSTLSANATQPKILNLGSVIRLMYFPEKEDSSDGVSYDSMELFGKITEFDSVDEEKYGEQQKKLVRQAGHDFSDWTIEGYKLVPQTLVYGDFDGDGLADAFAFYETERDASQWTFKYIDLVWFGGESAPRAFKDFKFVTAKKRAQYTEKNIDTAMHLKKKNINFKSKPEIRPLWTQSSSPVESCMNVVAPKTVVIGNVNKFNLNRAILGSAACGTLSQRIYIFSKSREHVLVAQASTM